MMRIARQSEFSGTPVEANEDDLPSEQEVEALLQGARIGRLGSDPTV